MRIVAIRAAIVLFCAGLAAGNAAAQQEIRLWPGVAPGSEGKTAPEVEMPATDGIRRIASIHKPSIVVRLPAKASATGAAVIVLPGGAHRFLAIDHEGFAVAKWLVERGIAAFVLKYRLAREEGSTYTIDQHAVADARRAVRLVKSRAKEWGIDPARIGVMGFSAGGQVAYAAATRFDDGKRDAADAVERESSRPAFQALIYSGPLDASAISAGTPPAFLCVASDDQNPQRTLVEVYQKLHDAGVSAELHVYARGGHGFGMRSRPIAVTSWPARFQEWMADSGFLAPAPSSH